MMIAYAFDLDGSNRDALYLDFFGKAPAGMRGQAVSFGGRSYISNEMASGNIVPAVKRLQKFWEWRVLDTNAVEELREFGWWSTDSKFPPKWLLKQLIATLKKTDGVIDADFKVIETLSTLAPSYPRLASEALFIMVKGQGKTGFFLHGHRDEISRIIMAGYQSNNRDWADKIVDHLTKLGFEDYRNLVHESSSANSLAKSQSPTW
jgi:hypothetical protein